MTKEEGEKGVEKGVGRGVEEVGYGGGREGEGRGR
jgi:hypothetical protein